MPVEWLIKFVEVSEKLSEDLDFKCVFLGFLFCVSLRSFTISAVRMSKDPCAIELSKVILFLGLYLIDIVLKNLTMSVRVACTKRNVEKYIPPCVRI